jgi:glycosyltransferase involved in cell wall biosynthesis
VRREGRPLDLLFLTQTYPRFEEDVAGPFVRDLARGLARRGDRVTVLAPHAPGLPSSWRDERQPGIEVRTFRYAPERAEVVGYGRSLVADETVRGGSGLAAPLYALGAHAALRREAWRRPYDLVHAHWVVPNGPIAAFALGGERDLPLAIGLHGSDVFLAEKRPLQPIVRWTLERARLLTGCSPELVERVRILGRREDGAPSPGYPRQRCRVIPYGVDVRAFSPDRERRPLWRRKLGIPDEAPLLLGVGRMATKKGFQVLMEALPRLLGDQPDLHVVLAGGGDLLAGFREAAAPWSRRVHFPGAVLRDTLPDLYRAADLFVLPAVHDRKGNVDGLPNVILEAMASGLPVVSTPVSGVPLAVVPGATGLLAREGDAESLRASLLELLSDPAKARAYGEAGRRRAEAELTWDAVAGRYRDGYLSALEGA